MIQRLSIPQIIFQIIIIIILLFIWKIKWIEIIALLLKKEETGILPIFWIKKLK